MFFLICLVVVQHGLLLVVKGRLGAFFVLFPGFQSMEHLPEMTQKGCRMYLFSTSPDLANNLGDKDVDL